MAGDVALVSDAMGQPLPGVAPAAKQAGAYVARVIAARVARRPAPPPFRYRDFGNLATIGRRSAMNDPGWVLSLAGYRQCVGSSNPVNKASASSRERAVAAASTTARVRWGAKPSMKSYI